MSPASRLILEATLLSLIPGLFWLWFVESHRPARASWLRSLISFVGGAGSTMLVIGGTACLEMVWPGVNGLLGSTWGRFVYFVVIVGLVEEFSKLLSVRLLIYPRQDFREAWDGLAASSAAALGFATAENVKYILNLGSGVILPRSVLCTMGHVLMSGIWGYALGLSRSTSLAAASAPVGARPVRRWVLPALLVSAVGHGTYDFLLIQNLPWLALGTLGLMWAVFWSQLKDSVLESQRRLLRSFAVRECSECHSLLRGCYDFCTTCGRPVDKSSIVYCQECLEPVGAESPRACTHCGAAWGGP